MGNEININPSLATLINSLATNARVNITDASLYRNIITVVDSSMYYTAPDTSVYTWLLKKM